MKNHNLLGVILLAATLTHCGDNKKDKNNSFSFDAASLKGQYHSDEKVPLTLANPENKAIDSVVYYLNDKRIAAIKGTTKYEITLAGQKFGYQNIKALVFSGGESSEATTRIELVSQVAVKVYGEKDYEIVNTYPHDVTSYTQGLEFYRDTLIEGTGQYEKSVLRKNNYKTGEAYKKIPLEGKYFGEGITVFNDKIYQLTWRENTGFIYNAGNLNEIKEFTYFKQVEGWGLTHDDKYLYQSDGTEKVWKLDPETLKEIDYVNVYTGNSKVKSVNELEWVNGKLYGNIYQTNSIAIIDPATGSVEGVIDFSALEKKITKTEETDVLNGIAYNPKTKTLFITGKLWDKMFEIRLKN